MKNTYSTLYRFICIVLFTNISIALKAMPFLDTTKAVLASSITTPGSKINTPKSNVIVYPKSLQSNKEQTLNYIQKFSEKRRSYLINIYKKGKNFFPKIVAVLNKFQLPQELKVLVALESGFNGNAISPAGAMGYWQLMDEVSKEYGLYMASSKSKKKDDRTNFAKSTLVAAKYLRDRGRNLNNNLLLIVASYNWGIGNVWQAMKRTGKSNPDFWDIKKYLPAETRAYVMNFITLNVIFNNYDKFVKNQLVFAPDEQGENEIAEDVVINESTAVVAN